jgi:hypothetical protein
MSHSQKLELQLTDFDGRTNTSSVSIRGKMQFKNRTRETEADVPPRGDPHPSPLEEVPSSKEPYGMILASKLTAGV